MKTLVGAADPGPRDTWVLTSPQTSTTSSVVGWSVVLSPRPGWRRALPWETPGELTPEARA